MKSPNIVALKSIEDYLRSGPQAQIRGHGWVPARPVGYSSLRSRLKAAWLVFTGRADALIWPGQ